MPLEPAPMTQTRGSSGLKWGWSIGIRPSQYTTAPCPALPAVLVVAFALGAELVLAARPQLGAELVAALAGERHDLALEGRHAAHHHPVVGARVPEQEAIGIAEARARDLLGDEVGAPLVPEAVREGLHERP